ncbi:YgjV family protein [Sphingomonas paucimobilis]|uniref:YgjV family protein n=1 Tax=Sphingomonas paucimobilis TaxID=13689 RepID=UPI0024355BAC|nr:YgjV family protein [Sphingomonas paucimobilis]MDG5973370.1 YgjV family protein [Sphingomonas paucimobilis]
MSLFLDQTFASTGLAAILFGIVGLGCVVSWPLLPSRRGALMVQGTGACAFALHFALIGAPTASAACVLSLMQLTVALVVRDRVAKLALDGATLLALLLLTVATWHGLLSGLAACGGAASFMARTQRSTTRMKMVFLVAAPFWLAHNLLIGAPFALAVDLVSVAGNLLGLFAFWKRKQRGADGPRSLSCPTQLSPRHAFRSGHLSLGKLAIPKSARALQGAQVFT